MKQILTVGFNEGLKDGSPVVGRAVVGPENTVGAHVGFFVGVTATTSGAISSTTGQLGIRQYSHSTSGFVVIHHGHSPVGDRQ